MADKIWELTDMISQKYIHFMRSVKKGKKEDKL